jgi:hypothetical protein
MEERIMDLAGSAPTPPGARIGLDGLRELGWLRLFLLGFGALWLVMTVALYQRAAWATALWPWADSRMSFIFLASIAAAIAVPTIWVGLTGELAALAAQTLDSAVVNGLAAAYLLGRVLWHDDEVLVAAVVCVAMSVASLLIFLWSRRLPIRDPRPTPRFVRGWFAFFVAALVLVGAALFFQVERVFPWDLEPRSSTIFGAVFLGSALFFAYAALRPRWTFAACALWAFLAYDLVLAIPYLQMIGKEADGGNSTGMYGYVSSTGGNGVNEQSLTVYLAVIAASIALTLYCFLVHPATRIVRRPR